MARIIAAVRRRIQASVTEDRGMALMLVLLIMMLLSALMIGFMANIMADTRSSGVDRDETQAYAVAHAGMEKLTSDLAALFSSDYSPNGTQISNVAANQPSLPPFTYTDPDGTSGYKVQYTAQIVGNTNPCPAGCEIVSTPTTRPPIPDDPSAGTTIAAGPYQGFKGMVTHYNIMVTSRSTSGSEVRMRRELQTVAVPVFQFGLFSESPLSFHAGVDFSFGGRVHTNSDIFITAGNSTTLTLSDKVTAVGEVVRKYLDNGLLATGNWGGTVSMAKGTGVYRNLLNTEGSVTGNSGTGQVLNSTWTQTSVGTYNGYIRNGRTGARRLDLPLVAYGALPIDLIRRPPLPYLCATTGTVLAENVCDLLIYNQRYYKQAALRIQLSDTTADITGLPDATAGAPVSLETVPAVACALSVGCFGPTGKQTPLATSPGGGNYRSNNNTPLVGGYIKIDRQNTDGTWNDVTAEILAWGISGRNLNNGNANGSQAFTPSSPNADSSLSTAVKNVLNTCLDDEIQPDAIIRLQRVKDIPSTSGSASMKYHCAADNTTGAPSTTSSDYWPLSLYDAREGVKRDEASANATDSIFIGGVMYYVELDVNNLAKWFLRSSPYGSGTGNLAKNDNNGYIVYFSDRRNDRNTGNAETGEYGNEDIINPASQTGAANATLDAGEDVNATTRTTYVAALDTYGNLPSYLGVKGNGTTTGVPAGAAAPFAGGNKANDLYTSASGSITTRAAVVRGNRPLFFRRALKLVNGGSFPSALTGLMIVSENPVYVQGNYNATSTNVSSTAAHPACGIIADAINLLSNKWNDLNSFNPTPNNITGNTAMNASDTGYRFAGVLGKTISFPRPTTGWTPENDFGTDGGAHNLFRLLEDWGGVTTYYRGSLVSFFISRQATGIYKSGAYTYGAGTRNYTFDTDFLLPTKLPPGTPMFRDVNTLTFRQLLRPNQ